MYVNSTSLICLVHFFPFSHSLNILVPQEDLTDMTQQSVSMTENVISKSTNEIPPTEQI